MSNQTTLQPKVSWMSPITIAVLNSMFIFCLHLYLFPWSEIQNGIHQHTETFPFHRLLVLKGLYQIIKKEKRKKHTNLEMANNLTEASFTHCWFLTQVLLRRTQPQQDSKWHFEEWTVQLSSGNVPFQFLALFHKGAPSNEPAERLPSKCPSPRFPWIVIDDRIPSASVVLKRDKRLQPPPGQWRTASLRCPSPCGQWWQK